MIDYTKVPRRLIYENREELDDFPIDEIYNPTVETVFYKALMRCPFIKQGPDTAQTVLDILNNAKYITVLIGMENHPELFLLKYLKIANGLHESQNIEKQAATMALVCNYIDYYCSRYRNPIIEELRSQYEENEVARETFERLITPSNVPLKPWWNSEDFEPCRIDVVVKSRQDINGEDIVLGIDYLIDRSCGTLDDEIIPRVLSQAKVKIERLREKYASPPSYPFEMMLFSEWNAKIESAIQKIEKVVSHYKAIQSQQDTVTIEFWKSRCQVLEANTESEKAFNATGNECFTKARMGLLIYTIASLKDGPTPVKAQLVPVISAIGGWEPTSVGAEMKKAGFNQSDIDAVAKLFEDAMPNFAAEIKKQIPRQTKSRK